MMQIHLASFGYGFLFGIMFLLATVAVVALMAAGDQARRG